MLMNFDIPVHLWAKGDNGSLEELYYELKKGYSQLYVENGRIKRRVSPVVVILTWNNYCLMSRVEEYFDMIGNKTRVCHSENYVTALKKRGESWTRAIRSVMGKFFGDAEVLNKALNYPIESPSALHPLSYEDDDGYYPKLGTSFVSYLARYSIQQDAPNLSTFRLPVDEKVRRRCLYGCDFRIKRSLNHQITYFQWQKVTNWPYLFTSISTLNPMMRWVANARESGGAVNPLTFPPSEEALKILLMTTGIDVPAFGVAPRSRKLSDLYKELRENECNLIMKDGKPVRLLENLFISLMWREWVLIQTKGKRDVKKDDGIETFILSANGLISTEKSNHETWADATVRCLKTEVFGHVNGFDPEDVEDALQNILKEKLRQPSNYQFFERVESSKAYPGLNTMLRIHFVKLTIRAEVSDVLGCPIPPDLEARKTMKYRSDFVSTVKRDEEITDTKYWQWLNLNKMRSRHIDGIDYINLDFEEYFVNVRLSSIMVGIEGSAPGKQSPFGHVHDTSGRSGLTAAAGGRKWRAFRKNNAQQVPADLGGMRITLTNETFTDLKYLCDTLDIVEPIDELNLSSHFHTAVDKAPMYVNKMNTRKLLNKRQFEKEFFIELLSFSAHHAKRLTSEIFTLTNRSLPRPFNKDYIPHGSIDYHFADLSPREPFGNKSCAKTFAPTSNRRTMNVGSSHELRKLLAGQPNIKLEKWRKNKFSAIDELYYTIMEGKASLLRTPTGLLVRRVDPIFVQLIYKDHVLIHEQTVVARLSIPRKRFITTKKTISETPHNAALERVKSVIEVNFRPTQVTPIQNKYRISTETVESYKFPGLPTLYNVHYCFFEIMDPKPFASAGLPELREFSRTETIRFVNAESKYKWIPIEEAYKTGIVKLHPEDNWNGTQVKNMKQAHLKPVDLEEMEEDSKYMTMHTAAFLGNLALAQHLLDMDANVNEVDETGDQPLHAALIAAQTKVAHLLIENKANVCAPITNRMRPIHLAVNKNLYSLATEILDRNADVDVEDYKGQTPLHIVAAKPETWAPTMNVLLSRDPTPELQDRLGRTPLMIAREMKNQWAIEELKRYEDL